MANTVFKLRRSSVAGKLPNTSTLSIGELGLNITDRLLYSSDGTNVWEIGSNNTTQYISNTLNVANTTYANSSGLFSSNINATSVNAASHTIGTGFVANVTGVYTNSDITLTTNGKSLKFATVNNSAYSYFSQQTDDNFVFYTTNASYGTRPVWSIFANNSSSPIIFSSAVQLSNWINLNSQSVYANGSSGTAGQVLTSNGSSTYWSTFSATVNTALQYTWTNTHTFQANVSFTGNGVGLSTNTGAIYFNQMSDANWKIGRNTGATTKLYYTNNSLDIIAANSNLEGIVFGWTGNSYLEIGYAGTFTRLPVYVGNSSVNLAINSTSIVGNTITVGSSNTAVFYNFNGQVNASAGAFLSNAYAALSGAGGNYLAFGQQSNFHQWIQSGYSSAATPVYYSIVLNPIGGNTGIGNTNPLDRLSVNGTTYLGSNVTIIGNTTLVNVYSTGTINASSYTIGTSFTANSSVVNSVSYYAGTTLIGNTIGPYGKTEGSLNVNSATQATNATNLNSQPGSYYTNATNITTGTLPYAQLGSAVVNTSGSFTLAGNTTLAGTNTVISSNLTLSGTTISGTSTDLTIRNATVSGNLVVSGTITSINTQVLMVNDNIIELADNNITTDNIDSGFYSPAGNSTSIWYSGIVRQASKSTNTNPYFWVFGSNTNPNTASTVDTSANSQTGSLQAYLVPYGTGGAFVANSTVVNITSNSTISSTLTVNNVYASATVNAASHTVGTSFTANATVVNAVSYYSGTTLIGNTTGPYGKTEATLNVNSATQATNATNLNSQPGSYYTNATNITTGTLPYAQIPVNIINTSSAFTISGVHTYSANVIVNATLGVNSVIAINGSNGIAGQVLTSNGNSNAYWAAATFTNGQSISVNNFVITGSLTANSSNGVFGQILTSNGSSVYWSPGGGGALPVYTQFTGDGTTTSFPVVGGYTPNRISVYLNGVLLRNGTEVIVSSGSNVVISPAPLNGELIDVVGVSSLYSTGVSMVVSQQFTANGTANSFAITGGYIANQVQVFLNGVKQIPGTDVDLTSGANVGFLSTPPNSYIIDVYGVQSAVVLSSNVLTVGANVNLSTTTISVGNSSVNVAINSSAISVGTTQLNSTSFTGTSNNTSFVGSVSAANVVSNAQLSSNLSNYQTTAGLSANVATLTSNNATYAFSKTESNLNVNSALTANNSTNLGGTAAASYALKADTHYIGTTAIALNRASASQSLTGITSIDGQAATALTANNASYLGGTAAASYQLNSTLNANIASYLPTYTGVVNASSFTVGASFVANSTGVYDTKGNVRTVIINNQTTGYTLVANDAGKCISITTGGVTVPNSVFSNGDTIVIYNNSSANQTITQGVGVTLYLVGSATTGNRTLAQRGLATALCVVSGATPTFVISGGGLS